VERRRFREDVAAEERTVEAGEVVDGGDEAAAAVEVEGGVEAGRVGGAEVLVGAPLRGCGPGLERLEVGVAGGMRLGGVVHRFAQDVQARSDARRVQVREGGDAGVHGLAGDEARREAARQPVPSDKAENAGLLAEPQEPGPQHQG